MLYVDSDTGYIGSVESVKDKTTGLTYLQKIYGTLGVVNKFDLPYMEAGIGSEVVLPVEAELISKGFKVIKG